MPVGLTIVCVIALGVYFDAKGLGERGIKVGSSSPAGWAVLTVLFAIIGVPAYLWQRSKVVTAASLPARDVTPPATSAARFCVACGAGFAAPAERFCGSCSAPRPGL